MMQPISKAKIEAFVKYYLRQQRLWAEGRPFKLTIIMAKKRQELGIGSTKAAQLIREARRRVLKLAA